MHAWRNPYAAPYATTVQAFLEGRDTPRKFLERCLAVIDQYEPRVKAFVTLNAAAARRAADASTRRYRAGKALSPLDGCPIAIKDIIATADMPTQMNSPVFSGWSSGQDAACVAALRQAGAVLVGKTVTTEFAIGYSGPTTNPFDPTRTPGGSSSGSAAAVGAGMVSAALGTQTQASTLRPASYCGAFGFKPSLGVLHTGGVHPLSATCDHLGILAASLEDVWAVASQISLGVGSPGNPFLSGAGPLPKARKPQRLIRLYTTGWTEIDDAVKQRFEDAVAFLRAQGVEVVGREEDRDIRRLEDDLARDMAGALDIVAYEMKWPFEDYIARYGKKIGDRIHTLIARAREMQPADYEKLLETRDRMRQRIRETTQQADGFISLASSGPAIKELAYTGSRSFLIYGSWLGLPAFSLPVFEQGGLPFGLQVLGAPHQDGKVAATARWISEAMK